MKIWERILFAISMTAVWCLVMPPYLYGILGIPVVFALSLYLGKQLPEYNKTIKEKFHWILIPVLLLVFYMCSAEFIDQWVLSSKMIAIAGLLGLSVERFLALAAAAGSVVGAYGLLYLGCFVAAAKPQRQLPARNSSVGHRKLFGVDYIFLIVLTLCFGMRLALNPWSDVLTGNDSAAYIYVGLMMKKGSVLYVDIFEHKGIFLYLMTVIGTWLTGQSLTGIWILELVNAFVTSLFTLRITKLFTSKRAVQYVTTAAMTACLTICMLLTDGNLSEEWALPWITAGLYVCLKYLLDDAYRFYEIIFLGIACAYVIFLRANMIAVFAAFIPIILIRMGVKKRWKDIGVCALNFVIGLAVILIPILAYSIATGSLQGMMDNYFLFSIKYCEEGGMSIPRVMWLLFRRLTIYSAVMLAACRIFYKNRLFLMNLWFYVLSWVVASMSGRAHAHYAIILIPAMIVPATLLLSEIRGLHIRKPEVWLTCLTGVFFLAQLGLSVATYQPIPLSELAQYLQEQTKPEDNVLMLGNNCIYYLEGERYTTNRYFYQTPAINVSDELYEEFVEELEETLPEAVFMVGDREELLAVEDENITSVYQLLDTWVQNGVYSSETYDTFTVYRLTGSR